MLVNHVTCKYFPVCGMRTINYFNAHRITNGARIEIR